MTEEDEQAARRRRRAARRKAKAAAEVENPERADLSVRGADGRFVPGGGGLVNPARQCTATVHSTGERCRASARPGMTVCKVHGGSAPQVVRAARERLLDMVDPALGQQYRLLTKPDTTDANRQRAINAILNRTGLAEHAQLDLSVGESFEDVLRAVAGLAPNPDPAADAGTDPAELDPDLLRVQQALTMGTDPDTDISGEGEWDD